MSLDIYPDRISALGPEEGVTFCLVTNSSLIDKISIHERRPYSRFLKVAYDSVGTFDNLLLESIPERSHILVISPDCIFESPTPESLGETRKLLVMPCNSTPIGMDAIRYFIGALESADVESQARQSERIFAAIENCEALRIVDVKRNTKAILNHAAGNYHWNEQVGPIAWGEQQIAPAGEISVMPGDVMEFAADAALAIDGQITLHGEVIVHAGRASFLEKDRGRIYETLAALREHPVVATIEKGRIKSFEQTGPESRSACELLTSICEVDSRYATLYEVGFGINADFKLWPGNCGLNEVYGAGESGVVHFGIGLTPFTQYALTFLCPESAVLGDDNTLIVGRRRNAIIRKRSASCGCL